MRFKLGLLIGFGLGWLTGKDALLTFFQGLRKPGGSSAGSSRGSSGMSTMTGTSSGSPSTFSTGGTTSTGSLGGTTVTSSPTQSTTTSTGTNGNFGSRTGPGTTSGS